MFSNYEYNNNIYHLHPEFDQTAVNDNNFITTHICNSCFSAINKR